MRLLVPALCLCCLCAPPAAAEVEIGVYVGPQGALDSDLSIDGDAVIPDLDARAGWEGRSFEFPIHAGLRVTWWRGSDWGFGAEVNHTKVYADEDTLDETGLDRLEFTDGLNIATVNVLRRFPAAWGRATPYLGAGLGVAVPHVEVTQGDSSTYEYQLAGPAAALMAGASVPIAGRWSAFAEVKATYSSNQADLDGGGTLETDIVTHALNLGLSARF